MRRRKYEPQYCVKCSGPATRSPFTPDQPKDSDLCAPCWWEKTHDLPLINLDELDDLIEGMPDKMMLLFVKALQGGLVDWHGDIGQLVVLKNAMLRIQVKMTCSRCGGNPQVFYAGPGLHSGAWAYIYDRDGNLLGNIRDEEYHCINCQNEKVKVQP